MLPGLRLLRRHTPRIPQRPGSCGRRPGGSGKISDRLEAGAGSILIIHASYPAVFGSPRRLHSFCTPLDDRGGRRLCEGGRTSGHCRGSARSSHWRCSFRTAHLISCRAGVLAGGGSSGSECTAGLSPVRFLPNRARLPCLDRGCCARLWDIPAGSGCRGGSHRRRRT